MVRRSLFAVLGGFDGRIPRPFAREHTTTVSDGTLNVDAVSGITNAPLHAFEVFALP